MNSYKARLEENVTKSVHLPSNLTHFLEHTMPSVSAQFLPKSCLKELLLKRGTRSTDPESVPFFSLGDLWESFDKWSVYGAGVPLLLDGEETVQYYVPYLSALQLYVRSAARPQLRLRKLGEESDISDSDIRDSSSESSSDGENESMRSSHSRCKTYCNMRSYVRAVEPSLRRCSSCSMADDERLEEEEDRGELLFEYFEESVPYCRVPLVDKISSLARQSLELTTLRSVDLLPTSWMSIAWYPIYRIPTGPTLQDLAACFLTYHTLGTPLVGTPLEGGHKYVKGSCRNGLKADKYVLPSFGLASYKLRGTFWTSVETVERRLANNLQSRAESFLKDVRVRHPDFEFFVNNGGRC